MVIRAPVSPIHVPAKPEREDCASAADANRMPARVQMMWNDNLFIMVKQARNCTPGSNCASDEGIGWRQGADEATGGSNEVSNIAWNRRLSAAAGQNDR